jgi:hypothetical protein
MTFLLKDTLIIISLKHRAFQIILRNKQKLTNVYNLITTQF